MWMLRLLLTLAALVLAVGALRPQGGMIRALQVASSVCDTPPRSRGGGAAAVAVAAATGGGENECESLTVGVKFYVLNLDRRKDRLEKLGSFLGSTAPWMCSQMCRQRAPDGGKFPSALPKEIIEESEWKSAMERNAAKTRVTGGPLTRGAVGVSLGHAAIWYRIAHGDQPWAVVLEDDVNALNPHFREFLCEAAKKRADGGDAATKRGDRGGGWEYVQLQQAFTPIRNSSDVGLVKGTDYNTGMYLITREAAKRGLTGLFPLTGQLDNPDGFLRGKTRAYRSAEAVAGQTGSSVDTDVQIMGASLVESAACHIEDCPPLGWDQAGDAAVQAALLNVLRAEKASSAGS